MSPTREIGAACSVRRYPEYRDSGVEWLGEIEADIQALERQILKLLADVTGSNEVTQ